MSKWIPVAERLPEPFVQVGLLDAKRTRNTPDGVPGMYVMQVGYLEPRFTITPYLTVYGERPLCLDNYTHWCELPHFDKEELK